MKQKSANPVTSSFDVSFCPMVNVKASVADPFNLTPEEERSIIESAAKLISEQLEEKISGENLLTVELYERDVTKGPLPEKSTLFPGEKPGGKLGSILGHKSAIWINREDQP